MKGNVKRSATDHIRLKTLRLLTQNMPTTAFMIMKEEEGKLVLCIQIGQENR